MSRYTKTLETPDRKYSLAFSIHGLNHLCVARELSELKLTVQVRNTQFDTWETLPEDKPFTEEDYLVFRDLLNQILTTEWRDLPKATLFSMSNGEVTRWYYTRVQHIQCHPFISNLPVTDTLTIHSTEHKESEHYSLDHTDSSNDEYDGTETVTMFNLDLKTFRETYKRPESIEHLFEKPKTILNCIPTADNIREFLRSL